MAVTASQIAMLRRMIDEHGTDTYTDEDITSYIEAASLPDSENHDPDETDWIPTYDLNAAAAAIWDEKAAALSSRFDFDADGGSYKRNQLYTNAVKMSNRYRSRRKMKAILLVKYPKEEIIGSELDDD